MTLRHRLARALRAAGRELLPASAPDVMTTIIRNDSRSETYFRAIEYVDFEQVPGDIVECGVFGGLSLAILAKGATFDPKGMQRRIVGIDSFEGLPPATESHARWHTGDCASMHAWHPLVRVGDRISIDTTRDLFAKCALAPPVLHKGLFADVLPRVIPSDIGAIALLHVDCDLYESTRDVLDGTASALQDGTMVLFDDWFHYKGRPDRGEARAFGEFLDTHREWQAVPWRVYGTFCQGFILVRR